MDVNDFWNDYECDGQLNIFDYMETLKNECNNTSSISLLEDNSRDNNRLNNSFNT